MIRYGSHASWSRNVRNPMTFSDGTIADRPSTILLNSDHAPVMQTPATPYIPNMTTA